MHAAMEPALADWFGERLPRSRTLDPSGLLAVAEELAARADLWGDLVQHDDDHRVYICIHRDDVVDAWLICWKQRRARASMTTTCRRARFASSPGAWWRTGS